VALNKTRVLVLYGGRSTEHEVSCRSAAFVLRNLDPAKYDVRAIAIDKSGRWLPQDTPRLLAQLDKTVPILPGTPLRDRPALPTSAGDYDPARNLLAAVGASGSAASTAGSSAESSSELVVFPVLHGSFGEDGTLQGMLELVGAAFVGPDTLGSAIGMDKVVAKRLAAAAGVPVVPWVDARLNQWRKDSAAITSRALRELGLPIFVKPARLGSSVGVSKVKSAGELARACDSAFEFDDKILIEKGLEVREIECAVLGDYEPRVSVPGEVIPRGDFYTYEKKYLDADGAGMGIPADLTAEQTRTAQEMSRKVFMGLELYGMARVDLFLERGNGQFWFNEVNTLPGMTEISQYPLLWKESGVPAATLLDELVDLALRRKRAKDALKRSI